MRLSVKLLNDVNGFERLRTPTQIAFQITATHIVPVGSILPLLKSGLSVSVEGVKPMLAVGTPTRFVDIAKRGTLIDAQRQQLVSRTRDVTTDIDQDDCPQISSSAFRMVLSVTGCS